MLADDIDRLASRASEAPDVTTSAPQEEHAASQGKGQPTPRVSWSWRAVSRVIVLACSTGIGMIAMRNCSTKQWREQRALEEQLRNLKAQSVTMEAKVMSMGRASQVEALVRAQGLPLEAASEPPRVIYMVEE